MLGLIRMAYSSLAADRIPLLLANLYRVCRES